MFAENNPGAVMLDTGKCKYFTLFLCYMPFSRLQTMEPTVPVLRLSSDRWDVLTEGIQGTAVGQYRWLLLFPLYGVRHEASRSTYKRG